MAGCGRASTKCHCTGAAILKIRTNLQIGLYVITITIGITALSGGYLALADLGYMEPDHYAFGMRLAIGFPLVIAPPVLTIAFMLAKVLTQALDSVEAFVKYDPLTGTLARSYFLETVRSQFAEGGALLLIDADHFKKINDGYGHDVGDEVLRVLGEALQLCAPEAAPVGRIGGEEFAMFLPAADRASAERAAAATLETVRERGEDVGGKPIALSVSIGIALIGPNSTLSTLFKQADEALYAAKNGGRDRYVVAEAAGTRPQPRSAVASAA